MVELYVPKPHLVRAKPLLDYRQINGIDMRIKPYTLVPEGGADFNPQEMDGINGIIELATMQREIIPGPNSVGVGFSIVSDGILNVCSWGGKYPSLLNQRIYTFDRSNPLGTNALTNPRDIGTFCCWEAEVVGHEGRAWREFLLSFGSEDSRKETYLNNRFEGIVGTGFN